MDLDKLWYQSLVEASADKDRLADDLHFPVNNIYGAAS